MKFGQKIDVQHFGYEPSGRGVYELLRIDVAPMWNYAYDRQHYRRRIEVSISPTGRSVQVWVDGVKVA